MAALRQGGADAYNASLGQGLFSDPIDKTITSFVVFMILASLSGRVIARFPLGEHRASRRAHLSTDGSLCRHRREPSAWVTRVRSFPISCNPWPTGGAYRALNPTTAGHRRPARR